MTWSTALRRSIRISSSKRAIRFRALIRPGSATRIRGGFALARRSRPVLSASPASPRSSSTFFGPPRRPGALPCPALSAALEDRARPANSAIRDEDRRWCRETGMGHPGMLPVRPAAGGWESGVRNRMWPPPADWSVTMAHLPHIGLPDIGVAGIGVAGIGVVAAAAAPPDRPLPETSGMRAEAAR